MSGPLSIIPAIVPRMAVKNPRPCRSASDPTCPRTIPRFHKPSEMNLAGTWQIFPCRKNRFSVYTRIVRCGKRICAASCTPDRMSAPERRFFRKKESPRAQPRIPDDSSDKFWFQHSYNFGAIALPTINDLLSIRSIGSFKFIRAFSFSVLMFCGVLIKTVFGFLPGALAITFPKSRRVPVGKSGRMPTVKTKMGQWQNKYAIKLEFFRNNFKGGRTFMVTLSFMSTADDFIQY